MKDPSDPPAGAGRETRRTGLLLAGMGVLLVVSTWLGFSTPEATLDRPALRATGNNAAKFFQANVDALRLRGTAGGRQATPIQPTAAPRIPVRSSKASSSARGSAPAAAVVAPKPPPLTKHTFTASQPALPGDPNPFDRRH